MPICKNTSELLIWAKNYSNDNKLHIQLNVTILNTLIMVRWSHKTYVTNKLMTVYLQQLESYYFTLNLHGTQALKGKFTVASFPRSHASHKLSVPKAPLQWAKYSNCCNRKLFSEHTQKEHCSIASAQVLVTLLHPRV